VTPIQRRTGYREWLRRPLLDLGNDIKRELETAGLGFQELHLIARRFAGAGAFVRRFTDGTGAAFDEQLAFLACCRDVLEIRYDDLAAEALALSMRTAGCLGWWWVQEDVCVIGERPIEMTRDDRGRLHHPRGPAVRFRDGATLFAWHGTYVPESWITAPERLGAALALAWPDFAQRRAALEIIGWKRVLELLPTRTIDADRDPAVGELVEAVLPQVGPARFLKVRCGTGRDFVLAVPLDLHTALEANAWTYALPSHQYKLEART
jgi:hypothetical protein